VYEYLEIFKRGGSALSADLLRFLKDWLIQHILVSDGKYAPYLAETSARR